MKKWCLNGARFALYGYKQLVAMGPRKTKDLYGLRRAIRPSFYSAPCNFLFILRSVLFFLLRLIILATFNSSSIFDLLCPRRSLALLGSSRLFLPSGHGTLPGPQLLQAL